MVQIFIMNGPDKGRSFDFDKNTVLVGRGIGNDIQMKDKSVSRRHIRIQKRKDRYSIIDLRSKNGTFIDGMRVRPETEYEVKEGMPIAVGKTFISIGRVYPPDMLTILDSIDLFRELDEEGGAVKDRPNTPKKNMELIQRVSNVLTQPLSVREMLEKVLGYIMELLKRVDRGVIILVDRETRNFSEVISIQKLDNKEDTRPYCRTVVEEVLKGGKPICILNTSTESEFKLSESIRSMQIRSVMCVPLVNKSGIIGVIYVDSLKRPHGFRREDLDLLSALSSPAALVIENATRSS